MLEVKAVMYIWGWRKKEWRRTNYITERHKDERPYGPRETERVTSNPDLQIPYLTPCSDDLILLQTHLFVRGFVSYKRETVTEVLMIISAVVFTSICSEIFSIPFLLAPWPGLSQNSTLLLWLDHPQKSHMTKRGQSEPFPEIHILMLGRRFFFFPHGWRS